MSRTGLWLIGRILLKRLIKRWMWAVSLTDFLKEMTDPPIAVKRNELNFFRQIDNNVTFLVLSTESITCSPTARRWTPSASAASGRTRWWSTSSSASTSTSSPTAAGGARGTWTRRTTRSPSSSSSPSSSRWPWWRWWSGAANGATSWPSVRRTWTGRARSEGRRRPRGGVRWTRDVLLQELLCFSWSFHSSSRRDCWCWTADAELIQR